MVDRLFVIVGAGASRGCAPATVPRNDSFVPPLVPELFTTMREGYADVLTRYPLAKMASADLRGRDTSLAIEQTIRERYRDSERELDQRIFRGILPYLQELLHAVSHRYTEFPQNYESLVASLLRLDEVIFVSLNYDLLLDNVLAAVDPSVTGIGWYVNPLRPWSLIKLHGSVNWGRNTTVNDVRVFTDPPLDLGLDGPIVLRPLPELHKIRGLMKPEGGFKHGELHYPVLSVPVGEADELVCPDQHVDYLKEKLAATQPLHLLLIGYSGNDREVLALVRGSERGVKTLTIVDRSEEAAAAVADRLVREHGLTAESVRPFGGDFDAWVDGGGMSAFVEDMVNQPF
jgi:hypothetical protein